MVSQYKDIHLSETLYFVPDMDLPSDEHEYSWADAAVAVEVGSVPSRAAAVSDVPRGTFER